MTREAYCLETDSSLDPCPATFGLIWAEGIRPPRMSEGYPPFLATLLDAAVEAGEAYVPLEVRKRVRQMLRFGKYKPSGRSKPASEFLFRAALERSFPLINEPVDVNNAVSLESGFPGSIFDTRCSGRHLLVRRGVPGESFVFNPSGQSIDLQDLLLVCRHTVEGWEACGNPVKDAMITKISEETQDVIAVLYVPSDEPLASATAWAHKYAELLAEHCRAAASGYKIIPANESR
jgi:DNA/RNA-binding domain of Phe-tRNA-synthetase-like protein